MLRVILSSQKSQWEKEEKKKPKDKLMNTYALVIKLFWLHYALFFSSYCFAFLFALRSLTDTHIPFSV